MKHMARQYSRRYALQALYGWVLSGNPIDKIENHYLEKFKGEAVDARYFKAIVQGVVTHVQEIDELCTPFLDRKIDEMTPIERCVLRIAVFELLKRPDVPFRVIIDEAIHLNKRFGSIDGFKYINGVLDPVAQKLRGDEVKERLKNK